MAVCQDPLPQRRYPDLLTPTLREGEEELLVVRQALDDRRLLAAERKPVGIVGRGQSGHVGDVFAQRLLAVDRDVGERTIAVVLLDELPRGSLEVGQVLLGPPVVKLAGRVEQGSLVVKAVADLVADRGADGAVVRG